MLSAQYLQDVGAMRFPDSPGMHRIFDLLKNCLNIGDKLILNRNSDFEGNQILEYNRIRRLKSKSTTTQLPTGSTTRRII